MDDKVLEKLELVFSALENNKVKEYTKEEKLQAAYALNMCTVSVSQIIDYEDLIVLEQEYDAILNNLNLENIPKDNALLNILTQILDTVTFFRISAEERKRIDAEYQYKIKNAIWSAVPSIAVALYGGGKFSWKAMLFQLANQIGIGYMNYRRSKAEALVDKANKEWELQKTAIEQLNGLRRELFNTAWRLAREYEFPDEYRLTERQINQFNNILMDKDELKKYERLEAIMKNFEAYPPFWYYIGNSANYIANSGVYELSDENKKEFIEKAKEYFSKYEALSKSSILRDDKMLSACILEHVDILLSEEGDNNFSELINQAEKSSGGALDILELCAMAYLKDNDLDDAVRLLKMLVNEDYNRVINGQILSKLYVEMKDEKGYNLLESRVDSVYLFPMIKEGEKEEKLLEFENNQKKVLKDEYKLAVKCFIQKYSKEWIRHISIFDIEKDYPETFFENDENSAARRYREMIRIYFSPFKITEYQRRMSDCAYRAFLIEILNEIHDSLFASNAFSIGDFQEKFVESVKKSIKDNNEMLEKIENKMSTEEGKGFSFDVCKIAQKYTLETILSDTIEMVEEFINTYIDSVPLNDIVELESDLIAFCKENSIDSPIMAKTKVHKIVAVDDEYDKPFSTGLFGADVAKDATKQQIEKSLIRICKEYSNDLFINKSKHGDVWLMEKGGPGFDKYFKNVSHPEVKKITFFIIANSSSKKDLLFTTKGLVYSVNSDFKSITPYCEVDYENDELLLFKRVKVFLAAKNENVNYRYKCENINSEILYKLVSAIGQKAEENEMPKIEIPNTDDSDLDLWFSKFSDSEDPSAKKMYCLPTPEMLKNLNIKEAVPDNSIIQVILKEKKVVAYRFVDQRYVNSAFLNDIKKTPSGFISVE